MKLFGYELYKRKAVLWTLQFMSDIRSNRVVLLAFRDTCSGNTNAIYRYIKKNCPDFEVKWAFYHAEKAPNDVVEKGDYINLDSLEGLRYFATSRYILTDTSFNNDLFKSRKQICIQMWHGDRGFKKVQYAAYPDGKYYDEIYCDYALSGSKYAEMVYVDAFRLSEERFLKIGCPRNDELFAKAEKKHNRIHEYYHMKKNALIVLYAPTLREKKRKEKNDVPFDYRAVLDKLEAKRNRPAYLLVRAHSANVGFAKKDDARYIDATDYPDMTDILLECDLLITDYSSCAGDLAITDSGIVLFVPCDDHYTEEDRLLYFELKSSPFYVAHNSEEILKSLERSEREIAENNKAILDFYGTYEDGKACQKLVCFMGEHKS